MSSAKTSPAQAALRGPPEVSNNGAEGSVLGLTSPKIQPAHRERLALVYVRQSSPHQVVEHRESRERQYALADYALTLGWARERVLVIDEDQGHSGQGTQDRLGFQRLLAEVTLDHVGIVLGLEMSRLSRSNKDWYHLLEVCAIFGTLLADQDGIYEPRDPNDRLLLGLKGTMSEMEIHTMHSRLEKGKLHKALRGELFYDVPIGYVKTPTGGLALDPDEQARTVVTLIFDLFDELGSAGAVFRYLLRHGIRLGVRAHQGPNRGQLEWRRPALPTLFTLLHHPFYAGIYAYGRCPVDPKRKHTGRSKGRKWLPMDQWKVALHDRVPAYISRERYARNQERLRQNRSRAEAAGTPRQGLALLSGIVCCVRCGTRLSVHYSRGGKARYECLRHRARGLERACSGVAAATIDALVGQQVLRALEPAALELSLRAGEDVQRERERLALHWQQQLERARYEAAQAERHYRTVDPENRLVARTLEQHWEQALRKGQQLQEEYDRFLQQTPPELTAAERERIRALATDIPALWAAPGSTATERKELVRCLLERVVVGVRGNTEQVDVALHWVGGFVSRHEVVRPVNGYEQLGDINRLKERTRQLRKEGQSAAQIAERLNQEGFHPATGLSPFTRGSVTRLLTIWGLWGEWDDQAVCGPGEWRLPDLVRKLRIHPSRLHRWIRRGWVRARRPRAGSCYLIWADDEELKRLRRLRDHAEAHPSAPYPAEATSAPRPQSRPKRQRPTQTGAEAR
jgi:DNA invertase Pin-like site-specific DNA recombinase